MANFNGALRRTAPASVGVKIIAGRVPNAKANIKRPPKVAEPLIRAMPSAGVSVIQGRKTVIKPKIKLWVFSDFN